MCDILQQASEDDNILPARQEEPEESAAEKIYATLRECREQADPKKQKGVQMQGYLLKKKEKLGRWKQLYFVLKQEGGDSHLYFYEVCLFSFGIAYRVFKCQVYFLKVVQLGAPWTNLHKFFFSDFLKVYIFCQVTKKKDFYSITAATIAECWIEIWHFVL